MTRALLLGLAIGGALVAAYGVLTRPEPGPRFETRPVSSCPSGCPVCQANALVVE